MTPKMKSLLGLFAKGADVNIYAQMAALVGKREEHAAAKTILALYKKGMLQIKTGGGLEVSEKGRAQVSKGKPEPAATVDPAILQARAIDALHGVPVDHDAYPDVAGAYYSDDTMSWWGVSGSELLRLQGLLEKNDARGLDARRRRQAKIILEWEESAATGSVLELNKVDCKVLGLRGRPR